MPTGTVVATKRVGSKDQFLVAHFLLRMLRALRHLSWDCQVAVAAAEAVLLEAEALEGGADLDLDA